MCQSNPRVPSTKSGARIRGIDGLGSSTATSMQLGARSGGGCGRHHRGAGGRHQLGDDHYTQGVMGAAARTRALRSGAPPVQARPASSRGSSGNSCPPDWAGGARERSGWRGTGAGGGDAAGVRWFAAQRAATRRRGSGGAFRRPAAGARASAPRTRRRGTRRRARAPAGRGDGPVVQIGARPSGARVASQSSLWTPAEHMMLHQSLRELPSDRRVGAPEAVAAPRAGARHQVRRS